MSPDDGRDSSLRRSEEPGNQYEQSDDEVFHESSPSRRAVQLTVLTRRRDRLLSSGLLLFAILLLCDSVRETISGALVLIARVGEADRALSVGEDTRNNCLQDFVDQRVQAELARHGQVLMVLQAAPKVCELNGINRSRDTTVLI